MSDMEAKSASNTVHSIDRALDIIEFLHQNGAEASISEIRTGTGLSNSTIHRILSTLKSRGYIYQNNENAKYWLGLRFYSLGIILRDKMPLVDILEPMADAIARKYGETVYVTIPSFQQPDRPQQLMLIRCTYSPYILRNSQNVGTVSLSHGSATGKCMMAYYPQTVLDNYHRFPLPKLTEKTITDWEVMDKELALIRARKYAIDSEEEDRGVTCIAVPLLDSHDNIIASISLSGPTVRIANHPFSAILTDLDDVREKIITYL